MIRGYFKSEQNDSRPYIFAKLYFPDLDLEQSIELLVDSGADATTISAKDALRIGLDYADFDNFTWATGIGGRIKAFPVKAILKMDSYVKETQVDILAFWVGDEPSEESLRRELLELPSLLGRDVLEEFALVLHQQTKQVLLCTPEETSQIFGALDIEPDSKD